MLLSSPPARDTMQLLDLLLRSNTKGKRCFSTSNQFPFHRPPSRLDKMSIKGAPNFNDTKSFFLFSKTNIDCPINFVIWLFLLAELLPNNELKVLISIFCFC